jgi:hypothetical protein
MFRNIVFISILLSSFGFLAHASSKEQQLQTAPSPEKRLKALLGTLQVPNKQQFNSCEIIKEEVFGNTGFLLKLTKRDTSNPLYYCIHDKQNSAHLNTIVHLYRDLPYPEVSGFREFQWIKNVKLHWKDK